MHGEVPIQLQGLWQLKKILNTHQTDQIKENKRLKKKRKDKIR